LYDWHAAHGAKLVEFGGWSYQCIIPRSWRNIMPRRAVGLFDISHGADSLTGRCRRVSRFDRNSPRDRSRAGQIRYGLATNEADGILDDVLVYRARCGRQRYHLLVVNASNRPRFWPGSKPSRQVHAEGSTT
jgi:aminomethyltransferase